MEGEKGKKTEAILAFDRTPLLLVCAKINGFAIREMFGNNVQAWVGKRITFYPTAELMPFKRGEECIRVYGSPDIAREMEITYRPPKRKPVKMTMHATGKGAATSPAEATHDSPPPEDEDELGGRQ